MDAEQALEHARQVGREVVRLGIVDAAGARRLYDEYARFVSAGVRASFIRLLASRTSLDPAQRADLESRFPLETAGGASAPARAGGAKPVLDTRPTERLERTEALNQTQELSAVPVPRAGASAWAQLEGEGLWLECEPLDPIPLREGTLVIGRDASCGMVLPHQGVSRRHAQITVSGGGGRGALADRTTYGTFVNGKPAAHHELEAGDVIAIGPYVIIIREGSPGDEADDTLPFRIPGFPAEAMHGKLEDVGLSEVLQQIEFNQKTGTLRVRSGDDRGLLTFSDGRPVYGELGSRRGPEAVLAMLDLREGEFSFMLKAEAGEPNIAGATVTGLLLEAGRRADEGAGAPEEGS